MRVFARRRPYSPGYPASDMLECARAAANAADYDVREKCDSEEGTYPHTVQA